MSDSSDGRNPVEVLADEFLARQRRGERPSVSEYVARHPELADEIYELFPVLLDMEDARLEVAEPTGPAAEPGGHVPVKLGDYRIVRELGRGGMGIVYEAEQESLGRRVALKVLARAGLTPQQVRRFEREARSAAKLHHTNIVPVFGVGQEGGMHYYVMQYIPGQPLDEVLKELRRLRRRGDQPSAEIVEPWSGRRASRPSAADVARSLGNGTGLLPVSDHGLEGRATPTDPGAVVAITLLDPAAKVARGAPTPPSSSDSDVLTTSADLTGSGRTYAGGVARIGVQVAEALEYAVEQGVIHRDVKPSNILLDLHGTAWVTDFGLAKVAGQEDLTHTGDLVGTLRYMAPERFRGQADRRSDVYALGLTLYELLVLRPAYDESDRARLVRQVAEEDPPRLTKLDPTIPRDLATVVHKAMAREPAQRYGTAGALAADLTRFLEDRPIVARRPSLVDRAAKWSRRYRAAVAAGALGFVLALAILAGSIGWIVRDRAARSELTEREASRALDEANMFQARAKWPEALEVVKRAEGFLVVGGSEPLHERVRELRKDLEMVQRLEQIRLRLPVDEVEVSSDWKRQDVLYARAFREYGIDVEALEPAEAARRVRAASIRLELTAALDHWAYLRESPPAADTSWKRLIAVAREADPDAWRNQVRDALERGDDERLTHLAASAPISGVHPQTLCLFYRALDVGGDWRTLQSLLRRAQREHPDEFWINFDLAWFLDFSQQHDEAIRFYTAALAVRPGQALTACLLGRALCRRRELDEAIALYRQTIERHPEYVTAYRLLGEALEAQGKRDEAIALLREASASRPDDVEFLNEFAWVLATYDRPDLRLPSLAVELGGRAVRLAPNRAAYWRTLGVAQYRAGHWIDAIGALTKSMSLLGGDNPHIAMSPNGFFLAMAHWQLGHEMEARQWYDRAVRWIEEDRPYNDDGLRRIRAEADELLQIKDRAPSELKKGLR
jgi:serine/threonine protein kinase/Flp pilus assembly protein TadD